MLQERVAPSRSAECHQTYRPSWGACYPSRLIAAIQLIQLLVLAANLAVALAAGGQLRVGLLDVDVFGPSLPRIMGVSGKPAVGEGTAPVLRWSRCYSAIFRASFTSLP